MRESMEGIVMRTKSIIGFENYMVSENGQIMGPSGVFLKPYLRKGYQTVALYMGSRASRKNMYVHRIIAGCFIDNPFEKEEVNHIDGDKLNNRIGNLQWVTGYENNLHAFNVGLKMHKGEGNPAHRLTQKNIEKIRGLRGIVLQREIGEMFDIDQSYVSNIQLGKYWKHILPAQEVAHV
jgi:hypothetical protein